MLRPQKDAQVTALSEVITGAAGVLFVDYTGLTVAESDGFRRSLRETDVRLRVVKNSLLARALSGAGHGPAASVLKGTPTALLWAHDDPVQVAKAVVAYASQCEHVRIKGGLVEAQPLSAPEAQALAKMASRGETQAAVAALARGPERRLLAQVAGPAGRVAGAVQALVKRLEQGAAA